MTTAWWLIVAWIAFDVGFLAGCAWAGRKRLDVLQDALLTVQEGPFVMQDEVQKRPHLRVLP